MSDVQASLCRKRALQRLPDGSAAMHGAQWCDCVGSPPQCDESADPLAVARGIALGVALGTVMWLGALLVWLR
jgi:hypothetical protein